MERTRERSGTLVYEPFDSETWRDPFTIYRRLREEDPVHYSPVIGTWVLTRFEDVWGAARDTAAFSSGEGLTFRNERAELGLAPTIVMMDPPDQTRYRRLVNKGFTPRKVADIEPRVRSFARGCLQALKDAEGDDFVAALARPLPCFVVAEYLGVPEQDRTRFEAWTKAIVQANGGGHPEGVAGALAELYGYFGELLERRRADPTDDMISTLARARLDDAELTAEEVLGYAFVMVAGGNDTTIGLLSGAAELLTAHRAERERLLADPSLIPNAVEELLRLTSPVQGLCRVATRDVVTDGTTIPTGSRVLLCYGAANRDPREFGPDAETLDVGRSIDRILAFGSGAHHCLGAAAARLQGRVVLEELLRRFPDFTVDIDAGTFAGGSFTRRYETLPFHAG